MARISFDVNKANGKRCRLYYGVCRLCRVPPKAAVVWITIQLRFREIRVWIMTRDMLSEELRGFTFR